MTKKKSDQTSKAGAVEINEEALDQAAGGSFSWGATNTGAAKTITTTTQSLNFSKIEV